MSISPLARNLLTATGVVGLLGLGAAVLVRQRAEDQRIEDEHQTGRAALLSPAEVAARAITAYDSGTYDPLRTGKWGHQFRGDTKDGVLTLGREDTASRVDGAAALFPETIQVDEGYVQTARALLNVANADGDSHVTHAELVAALTPYAGADGKLDESERRSALIEGGLGEPVRSGDLRHIDGDGVATAGQVVAAMSYDGYGARPYDVEGGRLPGDSEWTLTDDGSPAFRIADHGTHAPSSRSRLDSGPITSTIPALLEIERAHGNGNGIMSQVEAAHWVASELRAKDLPFGYVRTDDAAKITDHIGLQRLGRVDVETIDGKLFYDTKVPQAQIDALYGGNLTRWIEDQTQIGELRGDTPWQPDPESGAPIE